MRTPHTVRVAVNAPFSKCLTYSVPLTINASRGSSVIIPLGKRQATGVILGPSTETITPEKLKSIASLNDERPSLSDPLLRWAEWVANYYVYPLGQVLELFWPPLKQHGRKSSDSFQTLRTSPKPRPVLTAEQTEVVSAISGKTDFGVHLLFGVTGSGKTEVYLHTIEALLAKGKRALVLVPEISLTPQLLSRFMDRFGDHIAVIHSHLTEREKTNQWWDIVLGKKSVLIGARSALFCPIPDLGLIVLDEEHESSFKQDEKLRYHARDAAIVLAKELNIPIVLGSATPSLESWNNSKSGKFTLHRLRHRATAMPMPAIEVVDLRKKTDASDDEDRPLSWASPRLFEEMSARLEHKEQSAIFLNRRGVAHSAFCPGCGYKEECPNCSIALTLHGKSHLVCHYCDYQKSLPEICPTCREFELKSLGLGTEKIESELSEAFPSARILRADRDEIQNRQQMEELIQQVESGEADILVGTQMIAKGLDFPLLTLVGVAVADIAFNLPDFRAPERSFQLLSQVSGRSGRSKAGLVLIQTYNPEHPSVVFASKHDYEGFAEQELEGRLDLGYPPFGKTLLFRFSSLQRNHCEDASEALGRAIEALLARSKSSLPIEVLGPVEAPIFRIRNQYRYHILVKTPREFDHSELARCMVEWFASHGPAGVKLSVDVDPLNML